MQEHLLQYGYFLVFAGTIIEMDATILAAAFLAHQGYLNLFAVMLVSAAATTLANQAYYALARRYGNSLVAKPGSRTVERVRDGVRRHGSLLLLASRFLFGFRIAIPAACGVAGMPSSRFLLVNAVGAVMWVAAFGYAGYYGSNLFEMAVGDLRQHEFSITIAVAVCVAVFVFWRSRGRELLETTIALGDPRHLPEHALGTMSEAAERTGLVSTLLKEESLLKRDKHHKGSNSPPA